jgi:glycyl-tRNA synthetase
MEAYYDGSGTIGKRYARMDEVGTPWCITVDYQTLQDGTVTIRDRDTTDQKRIPADSASAILEELLAGRSFSSL